MAMKIAPYTIGWPLRQLVNQIMPPAEKGEKGKIVVSSYLSAFCFEAAR